MNDDLIKLKDNEIAELKNELNKVKKENSNLKIFNEDLRDQVKLLTGKLNLFHQLNETVKDDNEKANLPDQLNEENFLNDWIKESIRKKMKITDLVTETAQENVFINDYIYDKNSKTFYSKSTGWYYYEDRNLFYDPNSENYYSYDKEKNSYTFHSSLKEVLKKNKELNKEKQKVDELSDWEEGEILDSDEEKNLVDEQFIPPCIRLIIQKADNLDLGSLLIVTVTGAKIGSDELCDLILDEDSIDKEHAKVSFNEIENYYLIEDLKSANGTFLNDKLINPNELIKIKHDDILKLGDVQFLVHIHEKNNTCIYCEPGCVQAKLKDELFTTDLILPKEVKEKQRRKEMKKIQKKYGINPFENINKEYSSNYLDRASERRKNKGSSSDHFKEEIPNINESIKSNNKGYKLLEKMGWKNNVNDTQIIKTQSKDDRKGLGYL